IDRSILRFAQLEPGPDIRLGLAERATGQGCFEIVGENTNADNRRAGPRLEDELGDGRVHGMQRGEGAQRQPGEVRHGGHRGARTPPRRAHTSTTAGAPPTTRHRYAGRAPPARRALKSQSMPERTAAAKQRTRICPSSMPTLNPNNGIAMGPSKRLRR